MLGNHLFLCSLLFLSAPFQTLYAPKAVSAKRPIKALKLPTQSMIQLDLPQKSLSISPQLLAVSANAQFGKTQFFFETPCMISFNVFEYDKTQLPDISPSLLTIEMKLRL